MSVDIEKLRQALSSRDAYERSVAAEALAHLGADAAPATAELIKAARDKNDAVAYLAGLALSRICSKEAVSAIRSVVVPRLVKRLKDVDPSERSDAAMSLGELGIYASAACEALQELFLEPTSEPAIHAARALRAINTDQSVRMSEQYISQWQPVFIEQLFHQDVAVREFAAFALRTLDTEAGRTALENYQLVSEDLS